MNIKKGITVESCVTNQVGEIVPSLNIDQNFRTIKISDIHPRVTETNPYIFDITSNICDKLNISFKENEKLRLETSHYEFFEAIYSQVELTLKEFQSNSNLVTTCLQDFNNLSQPSHISREEEEWVNGVLSRNPNEFREVKILLTEEDQRNYLINIRRVIQDNINNPTFNQDLLDRISIVK